MRIVNVSTSCGIQSKCTTETSQTIYKILSRQPATAPSPRRTMTNAPARARYFRSWQATSASIRPRSSERRRQSRAPSCMNRDNIEHLPLYPEQRRCAHPPPSSSCVCSVSPRATNSSRTARPCKRLRSNSRLCSATASKCWPSPNRPACREIATVEKCTSNRLFDMRKVRARWRQGDRHHASWQTRCMIGFESEEDWFAHRLEHDPRFLRRIAQARNRPRRTQSKAG